MRWCSASFCLSLPQALLWAIWTQPSWVSWSANGTLKVTTPSGTCGWHPCPCNLNALPISSGPCLLPPESTHRKEPTAKNSIGRRHPGMNSTRPSLPFRKTQQSWWWEVLIGRVKGLQRELFWGLLDGSSLWAAKTLELDCFPGRKALMLRRGQERPGQNLKKMILVVRTDVSLMSFKRKTEREPWDFLLHFLVQGWREGRNQGQKPHWGKMCTHGDASWSRTNRDLSRTSLDGEEQGPRSLHRINYWAIVQIQYCSEAAIIMMRPGDRKFINSDGWIAVKKAQALPLSSIGVRGDREWVTQWLIMKCSIYQFWIPDAMVKSTEKHQKSWLKNNNQVRRKYGAISLFREVKWLLWGHTAIKVRTRA